MTTDRVRDPLLGRVLDGRYRIGARIARGGMATVYESVDTRLDRTVAVKVMHDSFTDDDTFARRFRREAQAAARLAHQNVVAVFDQGDDDGTLFLVMEFVPGITLRDLIREEAPLDPIRALAVIEPVLSALAAAHAAGMIHRDVKPENVLLADDGRVKVADFGLARVLNAETQHTGTGVLIGTVSYLSPELVVSGDADARVDVYAAGVLLYEMLTGTKPHTADSPIQVAYKHVHEDIPAPSLRVPGLPAFVDALVARATARDPSYRPADAGVLLRWVRRVRSALEAGVTEDPDLVADLAPSRPRRDPFEDTDGQMPSAIIDPSQDTATWAPFDDDPTGGYNDVRETQGAPPAEIYDFPDPGYPAYSSTSAPNQDEVYDQDAPDPYRTGLERGYALAASTGVRPRPNDVEPTTDIRRAPPSRRPGPREPFGRRRMLLALVVVAVLVIGLGVWYLGFARYTTTPGVLNETRSAAQAKVTKAGLRFKVAKEGYSETVPAGYVLSTNPDPGAKISKNGEVEAMLSRGPERHKVPDVAGLTLDQAQQMLQESRLGYGKATAKFNRKVPKNKVIGTTPAVGTSLRRGAAVDVVVSKGPKPIAVPDYTGKPADQAKDALTKAGLKVTETQHHDDTVPAGSVITQTPRGGTLYKGNSVRLDVSLGPILVQVPNTVGMGVAAAKQLLESQGFDVKVKRSPNFIGLGYVLSQDPAAGTTVPKGTRVRLYKV